MTSRPEGAKLEERVRMAALDLVMTCEHARDCDHACRECIERALVEYGEAVAPPAGVTLEEDGGQWIAHAAIQRLVVQGHSKRNALDRLLATALEGIEVYGAQLQTLRGDLGVAIGEKAMLEARERALVEALHDLVAVADATAEIENVGMMDEAIKRARAALAPRPRHEGKPQ